jgi:hypothetical protein
VFPTLGSTKIINNVSGPERILGADSNFLAGRGRKLVAFLARIPLPNQAGGAFLQENSEISFFSLGQPNLIQGNGPVGASVGLGNPVTFFDISGPVGAQITDHTSASVELYANSQAYFTDFHGTNQVLRNGTVADPRSAGIRVDGNSEAFLRGGKCPRTMDLGYSYSSTPAQTSRE